MNIRSKSGNVVLASLGVIYAVMSLATLVWFVLDVWSAAAIIDRALQMGLVVAMAAGVWFVVIALENLGIEPTWMRRRHHT